jgi:hypothetical protein
VEGFVMGTCCFAPTKRQFLWWYWLLLASIVGIPMLLAVLYVARTPGDDEEAKKRRGETAAAIFWFGSFIVALAVFGATYYLLAVVLYPTPDANGQRSYLGLDYFGGFWVLGLQFFLATVAANATDAAIRKRRWFARIPLTILCVFFYLLVMVFLIPEGFGFPRPAVHAMQFMACMPAAHYWSRFKDSPDTGRAWKALVAFVVAAGLFFLVSYFGEDFARLICGPPPYRDM